MTPADTRLMLGITAILLILAGLLVVNIEQFATGIEWCFALLFWSVGLGMGLGVLISLNRSAGTTVEQHD